jgi:hypothetical protein
MAKRNEQVHYQALIEDLVAGRCYGVFIDDTGSPGLATGQADLHPARKTWVAVILRPDRASDILRQMPGILEEFRELTGGREFHAAEVYGGKGPFANMPLEERLGVFRFLAFMFASEQFPILVQTFDPNQVAALHTKTTFPDRFGPFNLRNHVDLGLLWLLVRAKWFVEKDRAHPDLRACVFVDEGYKRHGIALRVPSWNSVFRDGLVCFARSGCSSSPPVGGLRSLCPQSFADPDGQAGPV